MDYYFVFKFLKHSNYAKYEKKADKKNKEILKRPKSTSITYTKKETTTQQFKERNRSANNREAGNTQ